MSSPTLSLTVSLADQDFSRTKSVGIFNLATGLTRHLAASGKFSQLSVLTNRTLETSTSWPASVVRRSHDCALSGRLGRIWWDQCAVYRAARDAGNDWLLLPKGFASIVRKPPLKLAAYVHDAMHDFYQSAHPGEIGRLEQAYFGRALLASLANARVIFTNTEFTAQEVRRIAARAGVATPQVAVAGIGFERPQAAPEASRRGVLVLASPFPHKRTELAMDWLARWQQQTGYTDEVTWVGRLPSHVARPSFARWRWHERLPEAEYRALLTRTEALVFFSDYEGFGMPPVEAALVGACPVFSTIPATREVMGGCGCAFSNGDYESFRVAMDAALAVSREQVATWAEELLARHNWGLVTDRFVAGLQAARAQCP